MVNSHANTVELALTVRIPNAHVSPRRGSRTKEATNRDLWYKNSKSEGTPRT